MIDPGLWASTPFNARTALMDYYGMEANFHHALAERIRRLTGRVYNTYPLGDGGGPAWLFAHQQELAGACDALGLPPPPDLSSYDLNRAPDFSSYMFLSSTLHRQLLTTAEL